PWASFRFHIAVNTLAFSYMLTATRSHSGLSTFRVRPCWANKKSNLPSQKVATYLLSISFVCLFVLLVLVLLHQPLLLMRFLCYFLFTFFICIFIHFF